MSEITLDVHAHLVPVNLKRLHDIDGAEWKQEKLWVDGHAIGIQSLYKPESLLNWMDNNGVDRALVSAPPPTYRSQLDAENAENWTRYLSDGIIDICDKFTDRMTPLPHLPIDHPKAAISVAHDYVKTQEMGFSIGFGGLSETALSDSSYDPLWKVLNDRGSFVFIHPGACCDGRLKAFYLENLLGNPHETSVAVAQLVFAGVPSRYPDIRFCLAHGGGNVPIQAGRWQRGFDTARPDIDLELESPTDALKRFYVDSILHNSKSIELVVNVFGDEHILFGSDWPFPMGLIEVEAQMEGTDQALKEVIFRDNPTKLLTSMKSR